MFMKFIAEEGKFPEEEFVVGNEDLSREVQSTGLRGDQETG